MPSLTLKGIPADVLDKLRSMAENERRSLNKQAILILERAVSPTGVGFAAAYEAFTSRHGPSPLADEDLSGLRERASGTRDVPFEEGTS